MIDGIFEKAVWIPALGRNDFLYLTLDENFSTIRLSWFYNEGR